MCSWTQLQLLILRVGIFWAQNYIVGRWTRGSKFVVCIVTNEQRISLNTIFPPTIMIYFKQNYFLSRNFHVTPLNVKCIDFKCNGLPGIMKGCSMSIQPTSNFIRIDEPFYLCESQPRRLSCLLA
jgi:hypothetical protein